LGNKKDGSIMAMAAYFDASGKEDGPVLTVGGYFASVKVCESIESDWEKELGGKGPFHLTDLGTESCRLGSKEWSVRQKVDFIKRLAAIVNRPGSHILSISVETSVYSEFLKSSPHDYVFGPTYSACAQLCFSLAELMLDRSNMKHAKVAYTFEKGDRQHELSRCFNEYDEANPDFHDLRSLHFLPKKTTLLQPTDLIAGKIQEVLLRAHNALGFLDNGLLTTPTNRFEKYYSLDGTSDTLLSSRSGPLFSFVANQKLFMNADFRLGRMFQRNPSLLRDILKPVTNQGKRARSRKSTKNGS
jgi:hypothetical protein